ncbi:MAG: hypothetical protein WC821_01620 [archaeon]|jgi:hypothetical protein
MDLKTRIISMLVLVTILLSGAMACNVELSSFTTEVRGTADFYSSISASKNTDIDIKNYFYIDSYSGSDCPSTISSKAIVSKYNVNTSSWETYRTTSTKSQDLARGTVQLQWDNEFNTGSNNNYDRYRIEGVVLVGSTELDRTESYVDIEDNSCSGIILSTSNITIDEARSTTRTFSIENNTNQEFRITTMNILSTNSLINSGSTNYDNIVSAYSSEPISVTLNAGTVSSNSTITSTMEVAGYLGNTYCSTSDIGRETFSVTVQNTGNNDSGYYYDGYYYDNGYSTSSDCDDILISANNFSMDESTESKLSVTLKNDSTKRFEILEVQTTNNGVELSNYYNEKYIFSGQYSDIIFRAVAPSVLQDRAYDNTVKVRGQFSDGRTCSFTSITPKTFNINVINQVGSGAANCSAFSLSAPTSVSVQNYGSVPFTITNGTNKRADIYIEGSVEATPSIISLPEKTSISRDLQVKINSTSGEINFRPVVEGCNFSTTRVAITNTGTGELTQAIMTINSTKDANTGELTLTVEVNNPTTKSFLGVLSVQTPNGWVSSDRTVSLSPGKNVFVVNVTPTTNATEGRGKVTFSANGQEISKEFSTSGEGGFAGLFAFGGNISALGIILLVIVAAVILVAMLTGGQTKPQEEEKWVKE